MATTQLSKAEIMQLAKVLNAQASALIKPQAKNSPEFLNPILDRLELLEADLENAFAEVACLDEIERDVQKNRFSPNYPDWQFARGL